MSAVLNMIDDTFMCGAIKSDEARLGGRGRSRIYSFYLSITLHPLTLFLYFSCLVFLHLAKKHRYKTLPSSV